MKVWYIWDLKSDQIVTSNTHQSGIYTDIISVCAAYSQLSYVFKNDFIIYQAEIKNELQIK